MEVTIYTKPKCSFCAKAKSLLAEHNILFSEKQLNVHFTREWLVEKYPAARTYPVVVVDGFYVGGYSELNEQLRGAQRYGQLLEEGNR